MPIIHEDVLALPKSRLNIRLSPEIKALIVRAAAVVGQDLTQFAASTLNDRAKEILADHAAFELTEKERRFFLDYLSKEDVREPSAKERELARQYKKGVRKGLKYEFTD